MAPTTSRYSQLPLEPLSSSSEGETPSRLIPPRFILPDPFSPPLHFNASTDSISSTQSSNATPYDELDGYDKERRLVEREDEETSSRLTSTKDFARSNRRKLINLIIISIPILVTFLLLFGFIVSNYLSPSTGRHMFRGSGLQKITREHLENGTFWPESIELNWLAEAGDGVYSWKTEEGSIMLTDVYKNETRVLVDGNDVRDGADGTKLDWSRFKVSADLQYILFSTDWTKQWRHSTYANFYIHDITSRRTRRLRSPSYPPQTSFATFSPKNHHVAYVHRNDLYVLENPPKKGERGDAIRVTRDGSETTFNGVPDWVYEEEVFSSDTTTWWSPTGTHLAFLSFDELSVPSYDFPIYNEDYFHPGADVYPHHTVMKYPKPGYANPIVTIKVFDLEGYQSLTQREAEGGEVMRDEEKVSRSTWELRFEKGFKKDDEIVSEVVWVGERKLMVKATNRIATIERVAYFDFDDPQEEEEIGGGGDRRVRVGKVVREVDYEKLDQGWAEPGSNIVGIESTVILHSQSTDSSSSPIPTYPPGYLDIVPSPSGYNHLAYFSPADSKDPVFLTEGEWEIDGEIQMVDVKRGLAYFIAANPAIERHLFSIPLPRSNSELESIRTGQTKLSPPKRLTGVDDVDTKKDQKKERGHYSVSFSPFGGVYQLNYEGPGVPWQKLVKVDDPDFSFTLTNNSALSLLDSKFQHAEILYSTTSVPSTIVDSSSTYNLSDIEEAQKKEGGEEGTVELETMELRPPLMDVSGKTKYPVLFQVYGGPNSQMVTTKFQRDWQHYLCTSLGYVIVRVDPRGTGFRGRKRRVIVKNRLGQIERQDVIETARQWSQLPYVDEKRIAVWGWSYGGFLTSKIVEANSTVFNLGLAVAPVTDWRYYDSVYTERYMSTPQLNRGGYENSTVKEMEGFKSTDFVLAHGSGDDNVHFQNTAALLDRFTMAHVRRFRFRMFTDSDHSMGMRGAYWELMAWLENILLEKFGQGGRTKSKWKIKAEHVGREEE